MARLPCVSILAAAAIMALAAARQQPVPPTAAAQPTWKLVFSYDCTAAPWDCDGPATADRFQLWASHWTIPCTPPACPWWAWLSRANPGVEIPLKQGGFYRLWFGPDADPGDLLDVGPIWRPSLPTFYLDVVYNCPRNPQLCRPNTAWQIYRCVRQPDGSCTWAWQKRLLGVEKGVYAVLPLGYYLLHWGAPRGLPTPTLTPQVTPTLTPTLTSTATPTPPATGTPTTAPTPAATDTPTTVPSPTAGAGHEVYLPKVTRAR